MNHPLPSYPKPVSGQREGARRGSFRARPTSVLLAMVAVIALFASVTVSPTLARGHSAARAAALVKLTNARILETPKGRTLYVFAADSKDKSTCYGQCATYWPPRLVHASVTPPRTIAGIAGTFGITMRTDGTHQLTYNGAPLYTFAGDKKAGDMTGQGLFAVGGYWWVVVAAGK